MYSEQCTILTDSRCFQATRKSLVDGAAYHQEWPTLVPIITHGIAPGLAVAIAEHLFPDPVVVPEQGRLLQVAAVTVAGTIMVNLGEEDIGRVLEKDVVFEKPYVIQAPPYQKPGKLKFG